MLCGVGTEWVELWALGECIGPEVAGGGGSLAQGSSAWLTRCPQAGASPLESCRVLNVLFPSSVLVFQGNPNTIAGVQKVEAVSSL